MRQPLAVRSGSRSQTAGAAQVRPCRYTFRRVSIPAQSIRLRGKGMPGIGKGAPGDLLLRVTVGEKPGFERKGSDVYTTVQIPFTTAVFGGEAVVPTLYGNVVCKIREGTQSGTKIRFKRQGYCVNEGCFGAWRSVCSGSDCGADPLKRGGKAEAEGI